MTLHGGCACGAVRYEADGLDGPIRHCHCNTCRKLHAAASTSGAEVLRARFRWTKGEDKLAAYESSPGKFRRFCSACGTHLVSDRLAAPAVILQVATLEDDPGQRPQFHIWTSHQPQWLTDVPGAPHYDEWEPGR